MPAQRDPYESPAIQAFANELKAWRGAKGKTELAETLGYTPQFISQIEAGKNIPSEKFAEDLDTYFETNGLFRRLWKLIRETRHHLKLPPGFTEFVAYEAEASVMYAFELNLIIGLFQTKEYAYAMLNCGRVHEEITQLVDKRIEWQEILARPRPPRIIAIFDEMVIRRMIGDREVMRGQIHHLVDLAERPNITMQIVPVSAGTYAGLPGAFTILGFKDVPDVVYIEGHVNGQLIFEGSTVREYALNYDLIRGAAMSADDSLKLLSSRLEEL